MMMKWQTYEKSWMRFMGKKILWLVFYGKRNQQHLTQEVQKLVPKWIIIYAIEKMKKQKLNQE